MLNYVPRVPSCHTSLTCLRAFVPYVPYVLHFLGVLLTWPRFFYVPYVSLSFTCLHFLRAFILFMYMPIKLTQINELSCNELIFNDFSSLLLLNSVITQRLLTLKQ